MRAAQCGAEYWNGDHGMEAALSMATRVQQRELGEYAGSVSLRAITCGAS